MDSTNSSFDSDIFIVESILKKKTSKNKIFYLVKWEGYDVSESTWEPESNLLEKDVQKLIKQYENKRKCDNNDLNDNVIKSVNFTS